jgi:hypothetical protein
MSLLRQVTLGKNDLSIGAFGHQKIIQDKTILSMMWNYDVPQRGNKEMKYDGALDYVEQTGFTNATSVKGSLELTSGTTLNDRYQLRTLQHARYQANRGYMFASSIILPNPTAQGTRMWGTFIPSNGVFLELVGNGTSYTVNFVVRNHWKDDRVDITSMLPLGADISKGNLWDMQMEWRGVGNYKVLFNKQVIYEREYIGTLDYPHLENPSLPISFECINQGNEVILRSGCAEISSEGGDVDKRYYGSVSTGTSLINVTTGSDRGTAVLVLRLPKNIPYGELVDPATGLPDVSGTNAVCYSRDTVMDSITTFCKDEAFTIVSASRGVYVPSLAALTGWTKSTDSYVEYLVGGAGSALDTAFQLDKNNMRMLHASRQELDTKTTIPNPNPDTTPFFVTSDSYLVVSLLPDQANRQAGCNIEFSEQI